MSDFKRIKIFESDLTTNNTSDEITDIVYVPGFANTSTALVTSYTPMLCKTVGQFEEYFGATAPTFASAQNYPISESQTNGIPYTLNGTTVYAGFLPQAVPSDVWGGNAIMFQQGDPDPSYIYAKELLAAGIPVVYERMNETDADITINNMYTKMIDTIYSTEIGSNLSAKEISFKYLTSGGYPTFEFISGANCEETQQFTASGSQTAFVLTNTNATSIISVINGDEIVSVDDYSFDSTSHTVTFDSAVADGSIITIKFEYDALNKANVICNQMLLLASTRGDAIALIDHTDTPNRTLLPTAQGSANTASSVYYSATNASSASNLISSNASFGTMFTPWINSSLKGIYATKSYAIMPASFAYLKCLAKSIKNNPNWLAIAGVGRGLIPDLLGVHTNKILTNAIAESYQIDPGNVDATGISINPITNIKSYGYCIWGNRTLASMNSARTEFATNFLNVRNLVSDIKKQAFTTAQSLMFEQNTDVLWVNFKALMSPMLDQMVSGYGISGYKIIKGTPADKTKLSAEIRIYPVYAVESFDIYVTLSDEEVTVE